MVNYEKLYHILFNAMTDALEQLKDRNYGEAENTLKAAQRNAEELYMQDK